MDRHTCHGRLVLEADLSTPSFAIFSLRISHQRDHPDYEDVRFPAEAKKIVELFGNACAPSIIANRIREDWPWIATSQVQYQWARSVSHLWKRADEQLTSVRLLLEEYPECDPLDVPELEGTTAVGWAVKDHPETLAAAQYEIYEVAMDATCESFPLLPPLLYTDLRSLPDETNAGDLEFYTIMTEVDGAGIPLSFCLLTTAVSTVSIEPGKVRPSFHRLFVLAY